MPESKNAKWLENGLTEDQVSEADAAPAVPTDQLAANDADGWQQYRRWISKAPAPKGRRVGIDPSLYTWKGYRNWTEQVKRNWGDEPGGDSD